MSQSQETHRIPKYVEVILTQLSNARNKRPDTIGMQSRRTRAHDTISKIIAAARARFTEDGHAALTLRDVAAEAGVAVGNLTYHFPTKRILIEAMLRETLSDYFELHLRKLETADTLPIDILLNLTEFYIADARQSHRFFCQVWGYAGSSDQAKLTVRALYRPIGQVMYYLVRAANPKLNNTQIREAVLQIFSLEEGYKLFIAMGPDDDAALKSAEQGIRTLTKQIVLGA